MQPNNTYLYYETSECDSKLNIEHAHGGFVCGSDGKWNTEKCIASYCDKGYILNDNRTKCIKDLYDSLELNEITINEENETKYNIEPNNIYIFKIENEDYLYSFISDLDKLFYIYNDNHILEAVDKTFMFKNNDKIYVNYYTNITNTIEIRIKPEKKKNNKGKDKDGLSTIALIFIIVGSVIALIFIITIIYLIISKKKKITNDDIEDKTQQLSPVE